MIFQDNKNINNKPMEMGLKDLNKINKKMERIRKIYFQNLKICGGEHNNFEITLFFSFFLKKRKNKIIFRVSLKNN
jgi:hypothetical protein